MLFKKLSSAGSKPRRLGRAAAIIVLGIGVAASGPAASARDRRMGPKDPGIRIARVNQGGPIDGLTADELSFFEAGLRSFQVAEGVADGLGPRFNLDSCAGCHSQPAPGGSSPAINPEVAIATAMGADNDVPPFVSADGPIVEARFKRSSNGQSDGGVHNLFVISGRVDSTGSAAKCAAKQEDFRSQYDNGNVSLRIPTPIFGGGLIEAIPDNSILDNLKANQSSKTRLGIGGRPNRNGNTGTIARFGWKAQNPSLLTFAGEAYNVEMGISNELFPLERDENPTCQFATIPNDGTSVNGSGVALPQGVSDIQRFAFYMKFLAPPVPSTDTPGGAKSISHGSKLFETTGCAFCHTPAMQTASGSSTGALANVKVRLYSDLALHHMGLRLADDIEQGSASGDEFRTAPLWGLGDRIYLLHDGRTSDLIEAIRAHSSAGSAKYPASEASQVITNFDALSPEDQQDMLNFLRSL